MNLQDLINSGSAWMLEGSIGRAAMRAIDNGQAILGKDGHKDYWGNYIPSRTEVKPATKGTAWFANNLRAMRGLDELTEAEYDAGLGLPEDDDEGWDD